jgi:hypothetical protein
VKTVMTLPDLVQAFLKKWWVESDFKAPNFPLLLRFNITVFKYRNKIGKIVVKTVPYSLNVNVKNTFTSHIDTLKKFIFRYQDLVEIYSVSAETIISDAFSYSENV